MYHDSATIEIMSPLRLGEENFKPHPLFKISDKHPVLYMGVPPVILPPPVLRTPWLVSATGQEGSLALP